MLVVADASVLVAELLRKRGRNLMHHSELRVVVSEEQWSETQHELDRRLQLFNNHGRVTTEQIAQIRSDIDALIDTNAIEVTPRHVYEHMEGVARGRTPRDPSDWPTVALALALDAGILTNDYDFLGCGCPPWSVETLHLELERE